MSVPFVRSSDGYAIRTENAEYKHVTQGFLINVKLEGLYWNMASHEPPGICLNIERTRAWQEHQDNASFLELNKAKGMIRNLDMC
ncbi:hypothetical protein ZWY2020_010405 [Hordeum vulgare]|nr:hypothetical protein ZWY2020_010405 [Hordeum vulgare]